MTLEQEIKSKIANNELTVVVDIDGAKVVCKTSHGDFELLDIKPDYVFSRGEGENIKVTIEGEEI